MSTLRKDVWGVFLVCITIFAAVFGLWPRGTALAIATAPVYSPFNYRFLVDGTLAESGAMGDSWSPYWWVNSGGKMLLTGGFGQTVQGQLPADYPWRKLYSVANPLDTANGYLPQNIFRLVTRSSWKNFQQQVYFKIAKLNMTASPQRNESNGVLLFNRYHDGQNLYYTGVRVDGAAVIKKKSHGTYTTLAYKPVFASAQPYEVNQHPSLLPQNAWMGLRSVVKTLADGSVQIKVLLDRANNGVWQEVLSVIDNGQAGGAVISDAGYGGIRTDFMDVVFDKYTITNL